MPLTVTKINTAKPAEKTRRLYDTDGMYLEISPAGGKWWRLKYRFEGREKRLSLGTYPATSLAEARERRNDARKLLAANVDPSQQRKALRSVSALGVANPFEAVAREWHTKKAGSWAASHARQATDILRDLHPLTGSGKYVFPSARSGDRPMSNNAVLAALRRMGYQKMK